MTVSAQDLKHVELRFSMSGTLSTAASVILAGAVLKSLLEPKNWLNVASETSDRLASIFATTAVQSSSVAALSDCVCAPCHCVCAAGADSGVSRTDVFVALGIGFICGAGLVLFFFSRPSVPRVPEVAEETEDVADERRVRVVTDTPPRRRSRRATSLSIRAVDVSQY